MTTSELNKERLQTIASWRAKYSAGHNVVLPAEEAEMMARSLLAAMEQEPFGYYSAEVPIIMEQQSHANITREAMGEYQFPLYASSQTMPELTSIVERLNLSGYEHEHEEVTPQNAAAVVDTLLKQLDDAVQKPTAAVPDEINVLQAANLVVTLGVLDNGIPTVAMKVWNACRTAMLQAGNSPVIPDGWIKCSERMPEEHEPILVHQEGGVIFCAEYEDGEFYPDEFPNVPKQGCEITHWMPLPAVPKQETL
ncbi:DUF551 domain-containing protein [Escherichia sp. E1130]|uniref:DUF551 domain-containing protein n=1 Tax=Escherichia sp. E1130 TaxID=2041645 RepID=UPI0010FD8583|nr:DUF551 domain-containing protein [Escherichia sp. E1130]TLI63247.1 DUF551 domain-containing protein [Escherichia sp. E1130]